MVKKLKIQKEAARKDSTAWLSEKELKGEGNPVSVLVRAILDGKTAERAEVQDNVVIPEAFFADLCDYVGATEDCKTVPLFMMVGQRKVCIQSDSRTLPKVAKASFSEVTNLFLASVALLDAGQHK